MIATETASGVDGLALAEIQMPAQLAERAAEAVMTAVGIALEILQTVEELDGIMWAAAELAELTKDTVMGVIGQILINV